MKHVLIVGHLWPYIGGSKRVIGLANYIKEFGWEPVILTAPLEKTPPPHLNVCQTEYSGLLGPAVKAFGLDEKLPLGGQLKERVRGLSPVVEKGLRKCFDLFREFYAYPDEHKRWNLLAISRSEEVLKQFNIRGMISVWPVTSHLVAKELKKRHGIPWIADSADLWSDNSAYPYGKIRHWFDKRLERRTFATADVLTTSSQPLADRLSLIHERRNTYAIMMGFNPELMNISPTTLNGNKFIITYTGVFYEGKRDPYPFFKALSQLIQEGDINSHNVEVHIYGPDKGWVRQQIKDFDLDNIAKCYQSVSYEECIEIQRKSHVLLQLNWNDKKEKGVFSGKFLDYLAAGRPILAAGGTGNDDVVIKILNETNAGLYAPSVENIKDALKRLYAEYRQSGTVRYSGNWEKVERYSNREMARQFAKHLDTISNKGKG